MDHDEPSWSMNGPWTAGWIRPTRPTLRGATARPPTLQPSVESGRLDMHPKQTDEPPRPFPKLPPELLDNVFSNFHPEDWERPGHYGAPGRLDLMACNAVCRSWHETARPHLFRDFVCVFHHESILDWYDEPPEAEDILQRERRRQRVRTLSMLLDFLTASPAIAYSIRRLKLRCRMGNESHDADSEFPASHCTNASVFRQLLCRLPRLRLLHLCNVALDSLVNCDPQYLCRPLDSLQISYVCRDGYWHIPDIMPSLLLCCFTEVKELHLVGSGMLTVGLPGPRNYLGPPHLRVESLILQRIRNCGGLLAHLEKSTAELQRLTVRLIDLVAGEDLPLFNKYLRHIGPRLKQLRVLLHHNYSGRE